MKDIYIATPEELGDWLKIFRERRGLTALNVSARTGTSLSTIYNWEKGRHSPTLAALQEHLGAMGYTVELKVSEGGRR